MTVARPKADLDTPALYVDLDLMERNIAALSACFRNAGVAWRPHTKGIKVPAIAHKLLAAGAIGITCAKLSEAEVMAAAGIRDILIANQVVGPHKLPRLAGLQRHADVMVAVDCLDNARAISDAAGSQGVTVRVLVEVNTGMNRCGVAPGRPTLHLAQEVAALPGIRFAGLMGWEGHVVSIQDAAEKGVRCREAVGSLVRSAELCRASGLDLQIVSCGGSGSYQITSHIAGVTEIQAGGAVFCDLTYRRYGVDLNLSLFVLAGVISRPAPDRAIVDAGRKAMNGEVTMPQPAGVPGATLIRLNAEHGILQLDDPQVPLKVGDKVDFVVGYGDNTVFLHDRLYGVRGGLVEVVWEVQGRGKLT